MTTELHHGYCALCISRCGCVGTLVDGVLTHVDPDPSHPTGKALCVKAKAAPEAVYAPDRILQPLRRTHPKGDADPGWERITWDDALELVADKMRAAMTRLGPQTLAFGVATPSGTAVADSFAWIHRFAHACHSPNLVFATENCNWHKDFAPAYTFGAGIGMPDYEHTRCILLWGFNPATSWLAQATAVQQARKRGAKLIVIDPRRAGLAASADLWLRPRPGSDGALALGLAHILIETERFDREFLTRWSDAPFLVADNDGRLLTCADLSNDGDAGHPLVWDETQSASRACPNRPPNAAPETRLALRGHFKVKTPRGQKGWITSRDLFRAVVEGEPYPISCLISFGSNFLLSKPKTRLSEAALEKLDFFALADLVETPTARYADLLLPVCSAWERLDQSGDEDGRHARPRQARPAPCAGRGLRPVRLVAISGWGWRCQSADRWRMLRSGGRIEQSAQLSMPNRSAADVDVEITIHPSRLSNRSSWICLRGPVETRVSAPGPAWLEAVA
jgi:anaerobic selenocysteine-containing dehydrogenase